MRYIRRHWLTQVSCDATHFATTAFVEDRNPGLESGAMLGESRPRHSAGENQMGRFGQAGEGFRPSGRIRRETGPSDCDRASAERRCRAVASVVRPSTFATAENGGFIRMTLGRMPASR